MENSTAVAYTSDSKVRSFGHIWPTIQFDKWSFIGMQPFLFFYMLSLAELSSCDQNYLAHHA